jgi:hypothetical protein
MLLQERHDDCHAEKGKEIETKEETQTRFQSVGSCRCGEVHRRETERRDEETERELGRSSARVELDSAGRRLGTFRSTSQSSPTPELVRKSDFVSLKDGIQFDNDFICPADFSILMNQKFADLRCKWIRLFVLSHDVYAKLLIRIFGSDGLESDFPSLADLPTIRLQFSHFGDRPQFAEFDFIPSKNAILPHSSPPVARPSADFSVILILTPPPNFVLFNS